MQDRKRLPRVHLIGCRGVMLFLPKYSFKFCQNLNCQNLSFWVVTTSAFGFYHNSSFWVFEFCCYLSSQNFSFEFCHSMSWVVTIKFFALCHNLSWVLVDIWVFSFVTIWVFELCHSLSFVAVTIWVFELVTIWVFEFCHNLRFWVLTIWVWSQF